MGTGKPLFILDIGTRSVTGIVSTVRDGVLEVIQAETVEHSARAVVDGQIEDIQQTARIARQVKEKLEQSLGIALKEVHVAAAGRVLRTERISYEMELPSQQVIDSRTLANLELQAVQQAYEQLAQEMLEEEPVELCSVGHTVVGYHLDGYAFSTLLGHRGRRLEVELIATFLPNGVVESLYATMSLLGLSIASITLEPIAAMNAVVPKELRLLNVALVDVGAGTSDIAVANGGSICGYTMATVAGDEVTERLMQEFLVDFSTAERLKFEASAGKPTIEYQDVLGFAYTVELDELLARMQPAVENLARKIAEGILQINGTPPRAVFMVGGGSRTPGLCPLLVKELGVESNRVAIGGSNYMKQQILADEQFLSAEYATPIGIAVTALEMVGNGGGTMTVSVNDAQLHLTGAAMTVMEALRLSGYQYGQIMGHTGKSIRYEYNGQRTVARGELPTLAEIQVNGTVASLSTLLQAGDEIVFTPAVDGADAALLLQQAVSPWFPYEVELFGKQVPAGTQAWVNDEPAQGDRPIEQGDRIEARQVSTVEQLLNLHGFENVGEVMVNGTLCTDRTMPLHPGDRITAPVDIPSKSPPSPAKIEGGIQIWLNGVECVLTPKAEGYQLFSLLNYVEIDPQDPKGEIIVTRNGRRASYLDMIQYGDQINIHWSQEQPEDRPPKGLYKS